MFVVIATRRARSSGAPAMQPGDRQEKVYITKTMIEKAMNVDIPEEIPLDEDIF